MRHAPPPLFLADDRARFTSLAHQLPNAMAGFGFECRLADGDPRVDFYGSVGASGGGRAALAAFHPPDEPGVAEAWRRFTAFVSDWSDPGSPLYRGVATVFLEFDAPFVPLRAPSMFGRLALEVGDGAQQWRQAEPLIDQTVGLLLGSSLSSDSRALLHQVFSSLPIGGHVVDIAAMLPRGSTSVRVFLSLPRHRLSAYLAQLGWTGTEGDLEPALAVFSDQGSHISLQLDVSDRISPRIGVETSGRPEPGSPEAWDAVIDRATAMGLCCPQKQSALAAWVGTTREALPNFGWPCLMHRLLSHVKLVIDPDSPGSPIEAKAYLWVAPRFSLLS